MKAEKKETEFTKAVIYARQSSGKDEQSESIEMQVKKCRELAEKMHLDIIGEFQDSNVSGRLYPVGTEELAAFDKVFQAWWSSQTSDKCFRAGLGAMLQMIRKVKYVIVDDLTRLARPVSGSFLQDYIKQELQTAGVVILTVKNGQIDYANYMDCLVSDVQTHIVDNQLKIQTQKSRDAMKEIKNEGYYPTGPKMFGIEYVGGKDRVVRVIPECAEAIRFIYDEILKLRPYNSIICDVNKKYKHLFKKLCYNSTFRHIAEQPFYAGYMYDGMDNLIKAKQMEGKAIISYSIWKNVQDIMVSKRTACTRGRFRDLPFSGKLNCGECGARLVTGFDKGKIYYFCDSGANALKNPGCRHARVNISTVRNHKDYSGMDEAVAPLLLLAQFKLKEDEHLRENKKASLEKKQLELANKQKRFDMLSTAFMESNMSQDECKKEINKSYKVVHKLKEEIAEIEMYARDKAEREKIIAECHITANQILNNELSDELYRKLLWKTIDRIDCFYDHIIIKTGFGAFKLDRYMIHHFRNFPRYALTLIRGSESDPQSCKYELTYIYGNDEKKTVIVDFDAMTIYSQR